MTLYLDVVWLLNFCIDLLLLQLTAFILKRNVSKWRLVGGALLASVFILFLFTPAAGFLYHPIGKFAYSVVVVLTVFGYGRLYSFIQVVFMFYFVTFMIGGGMFAFHYFMLGSDALLNGILARATPYGDVFGWGFVLIGFPCLWFFSRQRVRHIKEKKIRYDEFVHVRIHVNDTTVTAKGLVDSGNHLHDPITRTPVMIVETDALQGSLPAVLLERAQEPEVLFSKERACPDGWEHRIRLVPFRGLGRERDFLLAFKPDAVTIIRKDEVYVCKKVFVGLDVNRLSAEDEFNAIVHPKLLTGDASEQPAS